MESLPGVYRQRAVAYSDFWLAYEQLFPSKRHQSLGKERGKPAMLKGLTDSLRQRLSHLARKTLSLSKQLENHMGAIWYFVHHYNASLLV